MFFEAGNKLTLCVSSQVERCELAANKFIPWCQKRVWAGFSCARRAHGCRALWGWRGLSDSSAGGSTTIKVTLPVATSATPTETSASPE